MITSLSGGILPRHSQASRSHSQCLSLPLLLPGNMGVSGPEHGLKQSTVGVRKRRAGEVSLKAQGGGGHSEKREASRGMSRETPLQSPAGL